MLNLFTNFIKAHAAGIGGLIAFVVGNWTGLITPPPVEQVSGTLYDIVGALASFGIPWLLTAISPKNKPAA